ncbi:uncharacterized protein G2W53_036231 [Senna tora]|uniref:Uncharacterized protein n=1 Tax=Senna tora TaxID=362788 RepID=A0A834SU22_9FABA|nr:uncharacterized protein G2W53_036231 [Senna tora]
MARKRGGVEKKAWKIGSAL